MGDTNSTSNGLSFVGQNTPVATKAQRVTADTRSTASSTVPSSGGFGSLMRRRPLVSYFVLAFGLGWLGWLPFVLSQSGLGILPFQFDALLMLGAFGPGVAGVIMAAITGGKQEVRNLLRRLLLWRVGWQWYLFVLVVIPVVALLGFLVIPGVAATLHAMSLQFVAQLALYFLQFVVIASVTQTMGEEPGWRGFALPRLQQRYGPLAGTLILATAWTVWHLPLFLTSAFADRTPVGFLYFLLSTTGISLILTWVYNGTRGSLLLPVLLHGAVNAFGMSTAVVGLVPASILQKDTEPALAIGFGTVALLLILMTRGRLSVSSEPK